MVRVFDRSEVSRSDRTEKSRWQMIGLRTNRWSVAAASQDLDETFKATRLFDHACPCLDLAVDTAEQS